MKTIEFFYDIVSSYSYLAHTQIDKLAADTGATIVWRPMVLGAVFKANDTTAPITIPAKGQYLLRDGARWAEQYGVPFRLNSMFPFNSIKALRLILVAERTGKGVAAAKAAFHAAWVDDRDVSDESVLRELANTLDVDLAAIEDPAIKEALRKNTDEAIARGAFGAPLFFVGDEMFWGNDRMHFVARAARG